MAFAWTCPFCNRDTMIPDSLVAGGNCCLTIPNKHGDRIVRVVFIVCPNPNCKQFTLTTTMLYYYSGSAPSVGGLIKLWRLVPPSEAKAFPDYVPKPVLDDYQEACLIRDLSPKASATLARRCLQGMIRDFWGIRKARLVDEIDELRDRIDPLTWKAIDAVRSVGNIGAHMEKDINLIVDVEPEEAAKLIWLIEVLIRDWYITQHEREERLMGVVAVAEAKAAKAESPKREIAGEGIDSKSSAD
jgi:hypothetical protein